MYHINAPTLFAGKPCIYLPQCSSTNQYVMQLATEQTVTEGTLVITDEQTAGRGQMGNTWNTTAGKNITCSIVLKPTFLPISQQFYLTMAVALSVYDVLVQLKIPQIAIKWANDILVGDKKICGILIENLLKGSFIQTSIIGIGLNVNQKEFENLPQATSLQQITKKEYILNEVLNELVSYIEKRYLQLKQDTHSIKQQYLSVLYKYQTLHTFYLPDNTSLKGYILGIDEIGRLAVQNSDTQHIHYFNLKEIRFFA